MKAPPPGARPNFSNRTPSELYEGLAGDFGIVRSRFTAELGLFTEPMGLRWMKKLDGSKAARAMKEALEDARAKRIHIVDGVVDQLV